ncbi:MAG: hypothetical protein LBE12_10400 [Planctomycetaceae bacterium]|jgi:hypothetical protein|nr:hypothetical protein [Planctomycetaceae bacterium]
MKLTLHKISNLRVIGVTIISMILCLGIVAAEEISDFEKLLREALKNNQNNQTQKTISNSENRISGNVTSKNAASKNTTSENRDSEKPKPLSTASKNTSLPVIDAKPLPSIKPKEPVPIRSSVNVKSPPPEPVNLNDGWVAVKPNDHTISAINTGNEKSVLVAEATKTGTPAIDPNASIWDAVPETISPKDPKPQSFEEPALLQNNQNVTEPSITEPAITEPNLTKPVITKPVVEPKPFVNPVVIQPSPSPWDSPINKNSEPEPTTTIDWGVVANGKSDEKKSDEKKDFSDVPEDTVSKKSKESGKSDNFESFEQSEKSGEKTPLLISNKPAQNSETPETDQSNPPNSPDSSDLTVPKSKNLEPIPKKAEENSSIDMDAILNALAKESKENKEEENDKDVTKESGEKSDEKTVTEKKVTEKNSGEKEQTEKVNDSADSKTADSKTVDSKAAESDKSKVPPDTLVQTPSESEPVTTEPVVPDFDNNEEEETVWKLINADKVGDPHSKDKIKLMYDEIVNGLKARNITSRYDMWKGYARSTLRSTAGLNTGSELDGRCRLSWYQQLYNEPIQSIFTVEEYSRKLHHALSNSHRHLAEIMPDIRKKMDVPGRNDAGVRFLACTTPFEAINEIKRCLLEAQMAHARALSTLTTSEQAELAKNLIPTFIGQGIGGGCVNGHTIPNRTFGRRLCNLMEKMDKAGMYDAAEALLPLTNTALLGLLDKLPEDAFPTVMINGQKVQRLSTAAGDVIISGRENNVYDLDAPEMNDVACIIDLGGNDSYRDGTCDLKRPVLAIIDLHGNDIYSGSKPGIQGGSVLGVSILIDVDGNDTYSAGDLAQGSTLGGAGMLFDFAGHDSYKALRRAQGHALEGLGMLIDRKGDDKYRAAMWAQAFGAPGGYGILEDTEGNDHYYCGGFYLDSYPEHPGYDGWGQGVGAGIRQVANGGIGALLEGSGDDVYEVDYFGHGGGYWLGVGFVRDFDGNDKRYGSTLMAYSGGPRTQNQWTRFANGFGCHYSLGYCFDDNGDDFYGGTIMGTGMAWDLSIGYLCDFNGSDKFTATGGMTQGVGAEGSIGILFTYGGDDQFSGRNQAYSSNNITYHLPSNCGGNFSFLINYGGTDKYGCGAANNSYVQRGSTGGFLIDRPTDREAEEGLRTLKALAEKRNKEIADFDEAFKKGTEEAAAKGRRYVPRQRRPQPISLEQPQRLSSVPHFENTVKTGAGTINVK